MSKGRFNVKHHQKQSIIKATLSEKKEAFDLHNDDCLVLSFKHLDRTQGQKLADWEEVSMLAPAIETLANYCAASLRSQAVNKKFTIYGNFPPSHKTDFFHPNHVPEDAEWARIHVTGKQCLAGHVVGNTFYVVFLDWEHRFYISELKNT